MDDQTAVEAALFRSKPGTDREAFLAAAEAVTEDLRGMPGYLDRELSEDDDGQWLDLVHWASLDAAQRAADSILQAPRSRPFMAMLDPESITLLHLRRSRVHDRLAGAAPR